MEKPCFIERTAIVCTDPGHQDCKTCKDKGIVYTVKNRKQRSLLGIIGQTGLSGFCNHALERIANVINSGYDHEECETHCRIFRKHMCYVEQNKAGNA